MVYTTIEQKRNIKPGTKLWACAFELCNNKEKLRFKAKPTYGMASFFCTRSLYHANKEYNHSRYFIPFKNNSINEFKSKFVHIDSRVYADTYEECVALYKKIIEKNRLWFVKRFGDLSSELEILDE